MQKKDVIYIDVEDDITAIIGKLKGAKEKIVALVPPKRMGVLQSAVNLRLLARTADNADKRLVIITGNAALAGLAGSAKIPVAKTLQSRPEIIEAPELADDEDIIEGGDLPVGDHAKLPKDSDDADEANIEDLDIEDEPAAKAETEKKPKKKRGVKVPDFGMFRKKLVLLGVLGIALVAFLSWAIWVAPRATVILGARTSDVEIQTPVTIGAGLQVDTGKMTIPSVTQSISESDSVEFTPTGTKDVGEKATGTVIFSNCYASTPITIESGRVIESNGNSYIVQATVVVPQAVIIGFSCVDAGESAPVKVVADDVGSEFNTTGSTDFSVNGYPSGTPSDTVTANSSSGMSGGSKKTVKVVSVQDVKTAREQLAQDNSDAIKQDLIEKFDEGMTVIDESFTIVPGKQTVTPDIDVETTGDKATLAVEIKYSITAVPNESLEEFLNESIDQQLGEGSNKRIFDTGANDAKLTDFNLSKDKKKATVQLTATGKVGPKIDDNQIKDIVKGKRFGDVESELKSIDGISDVSMKLTPFWVFNAPDDPSKITIEFKLLDGNG